jgi:hypothetical protein
MAESSGAIGPSGANVHRPDVASAFPKCEHILQSGLRRFSTVARARKQSSENGCHYPSLIVAAPPGNHYPHAGGAQER